MADTIQHTDNNSRANIGVTTVVVNPDSSSPQDKTTRSFNIKGLQMNLWYFRTIPGILKLVELVIGIVCMACASPPRLDAAHWFMFVAAFCFIFTFIWSCIHFFSITSVLPLPWLLIELGYTCLATLLYFLAFIVMLVETAKTRYMYPWFIHFSYDAYIVAGSFGVLNFVAYAAESLFHAKNYLDSRRTST